MWGAEAQNLEAQLQGINARLAQLQSGAGQARLVATVNAEKCTGCGLCVDVCPVEAITLEGDKAKVDEDKCTECGQCVEECPNEAISIP